MLHRFAKFLAACTVLLVLAGSLVTSTASGLSVPDWPTSYGWNMFTFPPSKWVGGILYEHGHRLIASTVGFLTIILAAWLWLEEPRRWMRRLGIVALGAVIAQGVLGGLTVLFFLPAAVSTAHASLAEIFFCLVVSIALFTSPRWIDGYASATADAASLDDGRLRRLATVTTALIYTQILLGATMRHTGAASLGCEDCRSFLPPGWRSRGLVCHAGVLEPRPASPPWTARAHGNGDAPRRAGSRTGNTRRSHRAQRARRLDQQSPRRLRRAGPDNVAGAHPSKLAGDVPGPSPAKAGRDFRESRRRR